ncbi:hypothetical protein Hypma_004472 [Hypsizygus marmoreus]|uniref:Uncharacterized protein n=1 Tax=Hypsizygus marmoreus TaxID=39966 RepID=A0A369K8J4_HYPMA|nr:hypothetical protein Hypma_004472 [Hypsizygus marmoreus]
MLPASIANILYPHSHRNISSFPECYGMVLVRDVGHAQNFAYPMCVCLTDSELFALIYSVPQIFRSRIQIYRGTALYSQWASPFIPALPKLADRNHQVPPEWRAARLAPHHCLICEPRSLATRRTGELMYHITNLCLVSVRQTGCTIFVIGRPASLLAPKPKVTRRA